MKKRLIWITAVIIILSSIVAGFSDKIQTNDISINNAQTSEMRVDFIDVGQADSILIQADGHNMLIDAGNNADADLIIEYLKSNNVDKLDYLIGTHSHEDHIGGLDEVIKTFKIDNIIMSDKENTTKSFEDVIDTIANMDMLITTPQVGKTYKLGDAAFTIIAPNEDYGDDLNNWSVGIKLTHGGNSFLLCGDVETDAENDICSNGINISADVLKVSHHGGNTSTSTDFLKEVNPDYAVISCGVDNIYGHPDPEVLDELTKENIQIFRTDKQGTIIAISDGTDIYWSTEN